MSLDDVINAGKDTIFISNVAEAHKDDCANPQTLHGFLGYTNKKGEADLGTMSEELSKNPVMFRELINAQRADEEKRLAEITRTNYDALIKELTEDELTTVAISLPDKDKKWGEVLRSLAEGKREEVKEAYAKTYDNPVWERFIKLFADDEFIERYSKRYAGICQMRFVQQTLSSQKKDKEGKVEYKFEPEKARDYISGKIGGAKEEEKESMYGMLGLTYTKRKLEEEKKSKPEEKAKKP